MRKEHRRRPRETPIHTRDTRKTRVGNPDGEDEENTGMYSQRRGCGRWCWRRRCTYGGTKGTLRAVAAELRRGRRVAPRIVVLYRREADSDGWRAIEKTRAHLVGQQRCQRWALFGRVRLRWW